MDETERDWRRRGQEAYLQGATLRYRTWVQRKAHWDHDHCEFCYAKFMPGGTPGTLSSGYATEDGDRWVCPACFADFKAEFEWRTAASGDPRE